MSALNIQQSSIYPDTDYRDYYFSGSPLIQITNYPDRLGPSGKFVENSTKLPCLEITG
jgi:hypothetical protein